MNQRAGIEQMDDTASVRRRLQDIFKLQCRLAEQGFRTLLLQRRQAPQQGLGRGCGEQRAVLAQHLWVSLEVGEQRLEVFQVEQQ